MKSRSESEKERLARTLTFRREDHKADNPLVPSYCHGAEPMWNYAIIEGVDPDVWDGFKHPSKPSSVSTAFPRDVTASSGLGVFETLPIEMMMQICLNMDIRTLFDFRQINAKLRGIVNSLDEWIVSITHGNSAVLSLLRSGLALEVTLLQFYWTMRTKNCVFCGQFGGWVFLPDFTRCCFYCAGTAPETDVRTVYHLERALKLRGDELRPVRQFLSAPALKENFVPAQRVDKWFGSPVYYMPGKLGAGKSWRLHATKPFIERERVKIASVQQAIDACSGRRVSPKLLDQRPDRRITRYFSDSTCGLPFFDKDSGAVEFGLWCAGCAASSFRYFVSEAQLFDQDGFVRHFENCDSAKSLWEDSGEGTRKPRALAKKLGCRLLEQRYDTWKIPDQAIPWY